MNSEIVNNQSACCFEINIDGFLALLEYEMSGDTITLKHTEVAKELAGKGVGGRIVKFVLEYAQANGLKVIPLCPFARSYIDRHKEYKSLVAN
jgi:predicted GNAT family acetyltransferase